MAIIEEIPAPAPALARPTPADQRSGLRGVGVAIAEAAAGMGPSEPSRVAAARALAEALLSKEQGNTAFGAGEYVEALEYYSDAIDAVTDECAERAVFYGNRAACYARLGEHQNAVADCSAALALRPGYVKVLLRRAKAREALDEPSEAAEDMRSVAEQAPSGSKERREATAALPRLEAAAAAKLEAQKEEMLGKLKDLGNNILGRFGMSLDNFKAEKDPATGSYNISFGK
ncbi:tetratricopeptide repeat protein [Emiliania huxleyi CCMP1516]|uniref:Uncharacterized protein n=2 Tax=Emiliania huxleyi TaxID=2903 RepID=A0A0D3KV48_EMIH1|nr:hypothetical protein EMIHUDRAFT_445018 [Emiliania huxleyi CCMP1516]XP_005792062.1 tetratricopeptide repeat protein [Emiliania huxleyi CCMP1516]EOD19065.1 hypothetical protein EMIHUDRAFT_445018 [Emiliania huxleyi CCMP1516]EOD39633.1 tetratricopeptide repeat protein [Emiliania huxleyi CCMP1516]|mmetsp:Transcript_45091/g.145134  ORF Transcript_45091/g.145134 Transcript_45091/m.145134 type:complete len:231 (-) Transcript_45091:282-974(-)|eukprot:XP_005771494.1 hypothetical protein EMIHUDRAFT_445018 [Emiliania huxleyi CCMP1516]